MLSVISQRTISQQTGRYKKATIISTLLVSAMVLSTTGCSTTQEFKPTASVMVGAHKSL